MLRVMYQKWEETLTINVSCHKLEAPERPLGETLGVSELELWELKIALGGSIDTYSPYMARTVNNHQPSLIQLLSCAQVQRFVFRCQLLEEPACSLGVWSVNIENSAETCVNL